MGTLEGEMSREAGGQGAHLSSRTWRSGAQFEILKKALGSIQSGLNQYDFSGFPKQTDCMGSRHEALGLSPTLNKTR